MTPKFVMYLSWSWVVGTLLCLIIEGSYFGAAEVSIMNSLTVFRTAEVFGLFRIPLLNLGFFTEGLPRLLMWDYSFLSGGYGIIKWFLMGTLSAGAAWGITMTFVNVIRGIFT